MGGPSPSRARRAAAAASPSPSRPRQPPPASPPCARPEAAVTARAATVGPLSRGWRALCRPPLASGRRRAGRENQAQAAPLGQHVALHMRRVGQAVGQLIEHPARPIGVSALAALHADGQLYFVAVAEPPANGPALGVQVVLVGLGTQAHLLELDELLRPAALAFATLLLIAVPAVVHQAADRWGS